MLKEHYDQRQAGLAVILQKRWATDAFNQILPTYDNLEK